MTLVAFVAGISAALGILFLFIGLRRRRDKRLNLWFALFALAYAGTLISQLRFRYVPTIADLSEITRWDALFVSLASIALIWFIAEYTHVRAPIFLRVMTAVFAIIGAITFLSPETFYGGRVEVERITLPWGEEITQLPGASSITPWLTLSLVAQLALLWFLIVAALLQYRSGRRREATIIGVGLLWLGITLGYEIAARFGVLDYVLFTEIGFLGLAIAISLQFSHSVIRTEEALEESQAKLETRVTERTADLRRSNRRLEKEVLARVQIEHELRQAALALQQRMGALDSLHQIALILTRVNDINAALYQVCAKVTALFNASYTYIIAPDPAGSNQILMFGFERDVGDVEPIPVTYLLTDIPLIQQVVKQGKPQQFSGLEDDLGAEGAIARKLVVTMREFFESRRVSAVIMLPLLVREQVAGILQIATDEVGRVFQPAEIKLAETVANDVAVAIENARLLQQLQAAAVAEERSRLARDLHDAVTQTIYAATLIAETLPQVWERNPEEGLRNLGKLRQLVRGALAEMRTLLFELRPSALKAADLETLLHQLSDAFTGRTRIPVNLELRGEDALPPVIKIGFYRITQESFNNITKHARASRVSLSLNQQPHHVSLILTDNGRGFDPQAINPDHLGLQIMQERAAAIGAALEIDSAPGNGTTVSVHWSDNGKTL